MKKIAALWLSSIIMFTLVVIAIQISPPATAVIIYVNDDGGADYTKIQDAINASGDGDTVYVYSGIYYEHIVVNKTINLIGEDRNTTIIDGNGYGYVVTIESDLVNITQFTVRNGYNGFVVNSNNSIISYNNIYSYPGKNQYSIDITSSKNNKVIGNNINRSIRGINIDHSTKNEIADNNISDNSYGIFLGYSTDNNISNNTVSTNIYEGISFYYSDCNNISGNTITHNSNGIILKYSVGVNITGNTMIDDGIVIIGESLDYWNTHNIDSFNTVNGKTVQYLKNQVGGNVQLGAGQVILANCTDINVENEQLTYTFIGLQIAFSSNNSFFNNDISWNENYGIFLYCSHGNEFEGNTVQHNYGKSFYITNSNQNNISNNTVSNNHGAIYFLYSDDNDIMDNNFSSNHQGVVLEYSNGNNIGHNTILDNDLKGILLLNSDGNDIVYNNVTSQDSCGVYLDSSDNNEIVDNNFIDNNAGLYIGKSNWVNTTGNYFYSNNGYGIRIELSTMNRITGNYLENNGYCTAISLSGVNNSELTDNTMINNSITINGGLEHWNTHDIDTSNTINGKPVYYWKNRNGGTVPPGAGQVILANCTAVWIENQVLSHNYRCVQLGFSSNNTIVANTITSHFGSGIHLTASLNNNITKNKLSSIYGRGIHLASSSNGNNITRNTVSNNWYGFYLEKSSNNRIYHNNIWDNADQAYDESNNQWDNGYPSGGNNWDDYTGDDYFSGPNQDQPGSDGIGDTNYSIDIDSIDHYPSMGGFENGNTSGPVHNLDKDTYYDRIQDAVDYAYPGNTIFVSNGTYYENVVIEKDLNLIGQNRETTVIDGGKEGSVVIVNKARVNITGFNVTSSKFGYQNAGIMLWYAENCTISNNVATENDRGIRLRYSNNNNISGNCIYSNQLGIDVDNSNENIVVENNVSRTAEGIFVRESNNNSIVFNNAFNNSMGIRIYYCPERNIVSHNNASNNDRGIEIFQSDNSLINNNIASSNEEYGICLWYSETNDIIENIASSNGDHGIALYSSTSNYLKNNVLSMNGFFIFGDSLEHWNTHNIDTSNTVNGKPVYYWADQMGGVVPSDAGQVILANCHDVEVMDIELISCSVGVLLGFSSNNTISNITTSSNYAGIYLRHSNENNVTDINASMNDYGIFLYYSNGVNITNGDFIGGRYGFRLIHSDNNNITCNNASSNTDYGIYLSSSINNSIYHNIFINNTDQAFDDRTNQWDDGYPMGGNYWGDYIGSDEFSGPNQDQPGRDGIGDTNYTIDYDSIDYYPLLRPYTFDVSPPITTLIYPSNNSVIKPGVIINLSISDPHLDVVSYKFNDDTYQTLSPPYNIDTIDWDDGNYKVEIKAIDFYKNTNTTWYNFTIDSIPPSIILNSPDNNSMINTELEINLTISDVNINQTTYSKNQDDAVLLSPPYDINISSWPDGEYTITVYADDLAGNYIEKWFVFIKDMTLPEIILNSPENNSFLMQASDIEFDVTDANLDSVTYSINKGVFSAFEAPYDLNTTGWEDGEYNITIRAVDMAGNDVEKWFVFNLDTSSPSIISIAPNDKSVDVPIDEEITIVFDEPMDTESAESAISIMPYAEYSFIWSNENQTLIINFTEPLDYGNLYKITINTNAKDLAGHEMENDFEFEFTTVKKPKEGGEQGFPTVYLLLMVLVIFTAIIILFLIIVKKKKASVGVAEEEAKGLKSPKQ